MEENENVKQHYIRSFHDHAVERLEFLPRLFADGRREEAMALCLIYIDSFSQWLQWPSKKSGQNFVETVIDFGGDLLLSLVHPLQAVRAYNRMGPFWNKIAARIESAFAGPNYELQTKNDFLGKLTHILSDGELRSVRGELWRTTTAAIIYFNLRNPSVHSFDAGPDISFSSATYQGNLVPGIDFNRLHGVASKLHAELRSRSETAGQWFGNDEIIHA
jgi:hypothetical protein